MLIKSIFMELRSRLRSCNVFITTGVNFSKDCNLKISIQSTCIVLNYYHQGEEQKRRDSLSSIESLSECCSLEDEGELSCTIPVEQFCVIIPNSMSCLKIQNHTVSFRISTEPKNGNFYKELVSTNTETKPREVKDQTINVKTNSNVKIFCWNCSNDISSIVVFARILELPSAHLDMSDWFCHGHGSSHSHAGAHAQPNKTDFLYRLTHFVVDASLLLESANKFNSNRNIYHCNRCLAWLGLKDNNQVKLFNSEVKLNQDGTEVQALSHNCSGEDNAINDFIFTIEGLTKEYNLGLHMIMCKIVLECAISTSKKQYLLIWIMDRDLQVLRNTDDIEGDHIVLQSTFVTKILYKVAMSLNEEVQSWLADPGVVSTEISKEFCGGCRRPIEKKYSRCHMCDVAMPPHFDYCEACGAQSLRSVRLMKAKRLSDAAKFKRPEMFPEIDINFEEVKELEKSEEATPSEDSAKQPESKNYPKRKRSNEKKKRHAVA